MQSFSRHSCVRRSHLPSILVLMTICSLAPFVSAQIAAASPLGSLLGSWSGTGRLELRSGKVERIKCNAYNRQDKGELRLAMRCATPAYKVELRSKLRTSGGRLSGVWQERTHNAEGRAKGQFSDGRLDLAILGGGFTGSMEIAFASEVQVIKIKTLGINLKSLHIDLRKR